jgi:hypothetical protein
MPRLLLHLAVLASCAAPCEIEPTFAHDEGHEEIASVVEPYVLGFLSWTGPQCLAAVEVTERAPEPGEHRWERGEGWTLAMHPEGVYPESINWHLCDILLQEERPLEDAPQDLFSSETGSRESQFLDVCALGPTGRAFLEQARVCGPSPEERFVQDVVYDQHEIPETPDLQVVQEEAVPIGPLLGQVYAHAVTTEGVHVLGREIGGYRFWLDRRSVAGVTRELDLPDLGGVISGTLGVDADAVAFLVQPGDRAWEYELLRIERRTGSTTRVALSQELRDRENSAALIGDALVVAGTGNGIPGQLHVLSTRDGQVRSIDLPAPEDPQLTAAPRSLWPDPTRPGSLLVSYTFQRYEQLAPDFAMITSFDRFLAQLDLETGAWETLLHTSPWALDPAIHALGVTGDGRWVLRVDVAEGGALLGTLDAETGELAASGSLCLEDEEWPRLVIGDTLYETGLSGDTEVWTPYLIGQ